MQAETITATCVVCVDVVLPRWGIFRRTVKRMYTVYADSPEELIRNTRHLVKAQYPEHIYFDIVHGEMPEGWWA